MHVVRLPAAVAALFDASVIAGAQMSCMCHKLMHVLCICGQAGGAVQYAILLLHEQVHPLGGCCSMPSVAGWWGTHTRRLQNGCILYCMHWPLTACPTKKRTAPCKAAADEALQHYCCCSPSSSLPLAPCAATVSTKRRNVSLCVCSCRRSALHTLLPSLQTW